MDIQENKQSSLLDALFDTSDPSDTTNLAEVTPEVITPSEIVTVDTTPPMTTLTELDIAEAEAKARVDFEYSREGLKKIATEAANTLARSVDVAAMVDSPRNFEAVAAMVKASVEVHRELQNMHALSANIRAMKNGPVKQVNVKNGVVFNGSSADLLKLLKPDRK